MPQQEELIKTLIEARSELDRIYSGMQPTTEDEAEKASELCAQTKKLSLEINRMIGKQIDASLAQLQEWTGQLASTTARLREVKANIDGVVQGFGLVHDVLQVVVAIVALIL